MKVIYIISFCPKYDYDGTFKTDHSWINNRGEMISVWRFDWGHVFAKDVKRFFPEVEFEVWRPDHRAEKEYVHVFEDGVVHRSFPSQQEKFREGLKPDYYASSEELIRKFGETVREHEKTRDLVCHMPLDFSYLGHILLLKFRNQVPFLHTSHLNPQLLNIPLNTIHPGKLLHRIFLKRTHDKHKSMLGDLAVTLDRIDFFRKYTNSEVYRLDSLNFDFEWTRNRIRKQEARKKLGLDPDQFIFFSSSRLVPEKQLDKMFTSLAKLKNYPFLCIVSGSGESSFVNSLQRQVESLGLQNHIRFAGYLSDNLIEYYCASDIFITTSYSEGGPVSAIKAMALGTPVISTNTGVVHSLLKEKNAGILLDKIDDSEWANRIESVLKGKAVRIYDPAELESTYELKNSIKQLVSYYYKAIENFWSKTDRSR